MARLTEYSVFARALGKPGGNLRITTCGIDADGVYRAVDADAASQLDERLHRILAVEVDHLGALPAGDRQPVFVRVDRKDPAGAHQFGGRDGELADGPAAEYYNLVALLDVGEIGTEPAGRENVGQQQGLVVTDLVRELMRLTLANGTRAFSACSPLKPPLCAGPP